MLTRMRFQNWRSLKDVTIDHLTPITVFIGANSSGKTNIINALHFVRDWFVEGITESIFAWQGQSQIQTTGTVGPVEIEVLLKATLKDLVQYRYTINFDQSTTIGTGRRIDHFTETSGGKLINLRKNLNEFDIATANSANQITEKFFRERMQLLDENFSPPLAVPTSRKPDVYIMDRCAENFITIVEFMKYANLAVYEQLQDDARFLLAHVNSIRAERSEHESRLYIREKLHPDIDAPTISSGTARLLAMLAAYYVLDMRDAELPGLVVIEEPDTALNPGLLERFVEQLRNYTEGEHPRQFILTTHNPYFLNYFKPEEVQVVERGENGYTTVTPFDPRIAARWLEKDFALGEIWTSRAIGGVPA